MATRIKVNEVGPPPEPEDPGKSLSVTMPRLRKKTLICEGNPNVCADAKQKLTKLLEVGPPPEPEDPGK